MVKLSTVILEDFLILLGVGTSLVVQWLRLRASNAGGVGSISGGRTKIPQTAQCGQKKKKSYHLNKDNLKINKIK